jgi:hypothetical protein
MHEVRVTVPNGLSSDIARLAFDVGIDRVTVYPVLVLPDADADVVSVETSTPRAKAFFQDLWQLNHVTVSYAVRTLTAALPLGYGVLRRDVVSIVVAALFLPFTAQVLALGFGV